MMMAFTIQAQTIQVYKDGVVVKEYPASEVKSVEVKPVYYYYAGWECPKNEEDLAKFLEDKGTLIGTDLSIYSKDNPVIDYTLPGKGLENDTKTNVFVIIPNTLKIYDADKSDTMSVFTQVGTIGNHNIYKSVRTFSTIDWLMIF